MNTKAAPSQSFIFLEFLEPEINSLINGLRGAFAGKTPSNSNVHITVRGPYYERVSSSHLNELKNKLIDPILIHGAGIFENSQNFVVYLKINSEELKNIWWKPDYPIKEYGFNPHITVYSGTDEKLAKAILKFLELEYIKLLSHQYRFTAYVSKQFELFGDESKEIESGFKKLVDLNLAKKDLLDRAFKLFKNESQKNRYALSSD